MARRALQCPDGMGTGHLRRPPLLPDLPVALAHLRGGQGRGPAHRLGGTAGGPGVGRRRRAHVSRHRGSSAPLAAGGGLGVKVDHAHVPPAPGCHRLLARAAARPALRRALRTRPRKPRPAQRSAHSSAASAARVASLPAATTSLPAATASLASAAIAATVATVTTRAALASAPVASAALAASLPAKPGAVAAPALSASAYIPAGGPSLPTTIATSFPERTVQPITARPAEVLPADGL